MGVIVKGATAYEIQVGPFHARFLRRKYWFWPRRHAVIRSAWIFPALVEFKYWKDWRK